jgi:hypothetical protein
MGKLDQLALWFAAVPAFVFGVGSLLVENVVWGFLPRDWLDYRACDTAGSKGNRFIALTVA